MDLESAEKALKDSKEAKQYASNLAEAHGQYIDTMIEQKEAINISIKAKVKCKFFNKPNGFKFADKCKYEHCEMEEISECSCWL